MTQGMLDTSTVILLGQISDPAELPDESVISAVTLAELSAGSHVAHDDAERGARQQHVQQAEADFQVVPFDAYCGGHLVASPQHCAHRDASRLRALTRR
jgi:predicted nucleic acid-binding protein